jgi:transcriptional regulator with XRE-family HTH domain
LPFPASLPVFSFDWASFNLQYSSRSVSILPSSSMNSRRLETYLKAYRKKTGLTQREVSFLLGWKAGEQLSRYERRHRLPPLRTALACEAIVGVPVAELFAGIRQSVDREIEVRIGKLGEDLQKENSQRKELQLAKKKLAWLSTNHVRIFSSKA